VFSARRQDREVARIVQKHVPGLVDLCDFTPTPGLDTWQCGTDPLLIRGKQAEDMNLFCLP
jgi:hypothetical protein